MGEFKKHLDIAKEKLKAVAAAYKSKQRTVVGDLGTKVVEQLVEADAARSMNIMELTVRGTNIQIKTFLLKLIRL